MSFPAMRGYCRLILVRDGKSEVPQRILENKNLSCSLSVQHFLQGVSAAEPRFQLALWQSLLTWSTDENCCYHTQPVIQQTPYNFFKQPLVYQHKFFRSQHISYHSGQRIQFLCWLWPLAHWDGKHHWWSCWICQTCGWLVPIWHPRGHHHLGQGHQWG